MSRAIGWVRNLGEWSNHLTRVFVDMDPGPRAGGPCSWCRSGPPWWRSCGAPPDQRYRLPAGIAVVYIGIVLAPDLVLGGSRSQHVRYSLPAMLAILIMIAWVLGRGLESFGPGCVWEAAWPSPCWPSWGAPPS